MAACQGSGGSGAPPSTTAPVTLAGVGRAGCSPPTPLDAADPEIRATTSSGQAWGLTMPARVPLRAGDPLKIVWRVTGHGPLRVRVTGPGRARVPLTFGPEPHAASTYSRPGDEWGTGYRFPRPGCWHIHLARTDVAGDVWFRVT